MPGRRTQMGHQQMTQGHQQMTRRHHQSAGSLAVEGQKEVKRRKNWYRNDFGIKKSEMFHRKPYTKST